MICGWSHVLHAIYKPWGAGSPTYKIQHLSLFTTTFVFMMGLLLKVNGVVQQSLGFQVRGLGVGGARIVVGVVTATAVAVAIRSVWCCWTQ